MKNVEVRKLDKDLIVLFNEEEVEGHPEICQCVIMGESGVGDVNRAKMIERTTKVSKKVAADTLAKLGRKFR